MFKRVLLASDFSRPAEELDAFLQELQGVGTEEIVAAHVIRPGTGPVYSIDCIKEQEKADQKLDCRKEELEAKGFKVKCRMAMGSPSRELIKLANSEEVSLIIMGARGESVIKEIMLGSTTANLIRISNIPVFLEKFEVNGGEVRLTCPEKLLRILYPTDFSLASLYTFKKMEDLIRAAPGKIQKVGLVHVIDAGETEKEVARKKEEAASRVREMEEELSNLGVGVNTTIRVGTPSQNINQAAEEGDATLVMMATRGEGGVRELLLGSTAESVARRSRRPVLLFPVKNEEVLDWSGV